MASTAKKCIWQANPLVWQSSKFLSVSIKKIIDLETFGPPNGSEAFGAISGPAGQGLHPDGAVLLVALASGHGKCLKKLSCLLVLGHFA